MREETSTFFSELGKCILELLDHAILVIDKTCNDITSGCSGANSFFSNKQLIVSSLRSFIRLPLLHKWQEKDETTGGLYPRIVQSAGFLLESLARLYEGCSGCRKNPHANLTFPDLSVAVPDPVPFNSSKSSILDMDLDMNSGSSDVDNLTIGGDLISAMSASLVNQKLDLLLIMSSFFSISPSVTWETLSDLKEKESDPKVHRSRAFSFP